ncbi:MAG: class I SAM-dependent methyltransferase [Armatimonadetes bacterium]|nr:class I SAM-dependent methyltransferase [Armatimonadota bacterium]
MSEQAPTRWQAFFDAHAPHYLQNGFTKNTVGEVAFLLERLNLPAGSSILDMGCGVGRHAVELAKRGFQVTGVDLSEGMLAQARRAEEEAGVSVAWVHADGKTFRSQQLFDAAICLCEGGLGLADVDEEPVGHDLAILRSIHAALKPGAPFVLTALNGYAIIRRMTDEHVANGSFDPTTMLATYQDEWDLPEGKRTMAIRERLFIPPELVAMLRHVGFLVENVWGGTAGDWGERPIKLDEIEMMVWCRKG